MPARIEEATVYTAYCPDCDWFGEDRDSERGAAVDVRDHNEEEH